MDFLIFTERILKSVPYIYCHIVIDYLFKLDIVRKIVINDICFHVQLSIIIVSQLISVILDTINYI